MAAPPPVIPPLTKGDRIEDWRYLFEAATQHILTLEGGQQKAIQLIPAYVNRDIVDREAARDITKVATTLKEALDGLSEVVDPPMDTYTAMQEVCHLHWQPG